MIAKMRKLHLIALSYDRDGIFDAMRRTNAVEVREHAEEEGTSPVSACGDELKEELSTHEETLSALERYLDRIAREEKREIALPQEVPVSYAEFRAAGERKEGCDRMLARVNELFARQTECEREEARLKREIEEASVYRLLKKPFNAYPSSAHTCVKLGTVPRSALPSLEGALADLPLCATETEADGEKILLLLIFHRSVREGAESALAAAGFTPCPYTGEETGETLLSSLQSRLSGLEEEERKLKEELLSFAPELGGWKIYCDYLGFELEKAETCLKLRCTERTFLLEAFVPADSEKEVSEALDRFSAVFYEFSDPAEDEPIPTLVKNNKVIENFETITNMYSVPSARELDPNTVMSFFYSLFIGFIMADVGYGLLMMLGGGFLYYKNRDKRGGVKSLAGVFAVGGVFTILWGFLFNSLFGIAILPYTVMPDAQNAMWSFLGIDIPAVLIISLLIGIVQLMTGYFCKMAQRWHRGQYLDGIFEGAVWGFFSLGAGIAITGLLTIESDGVVLFHEPLLAQIGGILAGAMLVIAVLTAGRHEKPLGKIAKGFSSVYGLINYFTDVLSYIRLYGLMLTGAVIAQIISKYALQFMTSGSLLIVLGVVLMIAGHIFNLAISLLGAYIHTARLQYVEFFGKFYEGEGTLFTPLGSSRKYVRVNQ